MMEQQSRLVLKDQREISMTLRWIIDAPILNLVQREVSFSISKFTHAINFNTVSQNISFLQRKNLHVEVQGTWKYQMPIIIHDIAYTINWALKISSTRQCISHLQLRKNCQKEMFYLLETTNKQKRDFSNSFCWKRSWKVHLNS